MALMKEAISKKYHPYYRKIRSEWLAKYKGLQAYTKCNKTMNWSRPIPPLCESKQAYMYIEYNPEVYLDIKVNSVH